jgi:hypothetical protein
VRSHNSPFSRGARLLWACSILLLLSCSPSSTHDSAGAPAAAELRRGVAFQPIELRFDAQALNASFIAPDGRSFTPLPFFSNGKQVMRFTPSQPGRWRYHILDARRTLARGELQVAPATTHGFVHTGKHSFIYDDGTPFIAIGENRINIYDLAWNWNSLSIRDYIRYVAAHGMSVLRVFIVSDIENEQTGGRNAGVLEPALGKFDETVAEEFDEIFTAAGAYGVRVVLVAFALGFSPDDDWKSWRDNPYSKERGGPAATPEEFFESPAVRAQAAVRVRYLAARYGAFPSLLAIDLLNEPEWDGGIPETSWTPWAQEMARVWRQADPYGHPVTVGSVGLHWNIEGDERAWWQSAECDVVQWHLYGKEVYGVHALAAEMTRKVRETWQYDKPVLVGEFAYGGEAKPEYDHTHVGLWSGTFSGAGVLAHSAPPFNIDSDELMTPERARHFRVLRDLLRDLPALEPAEATATKQVSAWALGAEDHALVWLLAPKRNYGEPVTDASVTIRGMKPGSWRVRWIDDDTGAEIGSSQLQSAGFDLKLNAPVFRKHVAGRVWHDADRGYP